MFGMTLRAAGRRGLLPAILFWGILLMAHRPRPVRSAEAAPAAVIDVRARGAAGDGKALDTPAINRAIEACAAAGGGTVLFPPGRYLSGTVHLKSNVSLKLDAGARLVGTPDLDRYEGFTSPRGTPEARFPARWHRALILGDGVENVLIAGDGVIDGNRVFDPRGEEKMRGPHTILLGDSRNVTIRGVDIVDSANYAILLELSSQVEVRGVKVTGGWDGVHFRGWIDRPCRDLSIVGCRLLTGDDAIAGRYVENLLVSGCVINSACNGIRVIGPGKNLVINDCLFHGPAQHPHRSSDRRDMLSGIILQPGGWDACDGALEDVLISGVTMKDVLSPVTLHLKRPGNTLTDITVSRLSATGVRAAASVENWSTTPIGRVAFRDVSIEYAGGGAADKGEKPLGPPGVDARPLPAWGLYARGVKELVLEDVRLSSREKDLRPVMIAEGVDRLVMSGLRYPRNEGAAEPLSLKDVGRIEGQDAPKSSKRRGRVARRQRRR